jgi:hypothetical protein
MNYELQIAMDIVKKTSPFQKRKIIASNQTMNWAILELPYKMPK